MTSDNRYRAILDVGAALLSSLALEETLVNVARSIAEALDVWECNLWEYDAEHNALIATAAWAREMTADDEAWVGTVVDLGERDSYRGVIERREMTEAHSDDPQAAAEDRRLMEEWGELSTISVPLVFKDDVIGCLTLIEKRSLRRFSDEDRELLEALATPASVAIHNARVYRRQEEQARHLASLFDASRAITSRVVLDEVLEAVAREATEALGSPECVMYEYDREVDGLIFRSLYPPASLEGLEDRVGAVYPLSEYPDDRRVLEGGTVVEERVSDPGLDAEVRADMEGWGEKTCLNVPLMFKGEAVGIMVLVETAQERHFNDDEHELARGLGELAGIAISNARLYARLDGRTRQMGTLLEAGRAMASSLVLDEVFETITIRASAAFDSPRCAIYEYDKNADTLTPRSFFERILTEGYGTPGIPEPLDNRPGDRAILRGGKVVVEHQSDPLVDPTTRREMQFWDEKTALNVPLMFQNEPLGILMLIFTNEERRFTDDELDLAAGLGQQAAVTLQNARLYARQEAQNHRLVALLESSRAMAAAFDAKQTIESMKVEIAGLVSGVDCSIDVTLRGEDGEFARFQPPAGEEGAVEATLEHVKPDDVAERALHERSPVQTRARGGVTRLVIPLILKEESSGYVDLRGHLPRQFSDDEIEFVQILANQTAVAVENARLYRTVERQAVTDGLTGLYNHRYFYDRLTAEMARSVRYGLSLSLIMIDVDDFKQFNDEYGHTAGDAVLSAVGRTLSTGLRQSVDVPCRYGGEEFAIILPSTPVAGAKAAGAVAVGERLRRAIEKATMTDDSGTALRRVTVSIGVAGYPEHAGELNELVSAADAALYDAKRKGKNRVQIAGGTK